MIDEGEFDPVTLEAHFPPHGIFKVYSKDEIFDLTKIFDTSDEWITTRTGIQQRHFARDDETVVDMATIAAQRALENAKLTIDDIDLIMVATTTPELDFPSVGVQVAGRLGAKNNLPANRCHLMKNAFLRPCFKD